MLLYEILNKFHSKALLVHKTCSGPPPVVYKATIDVAYMGELDTLFPVEIKNSKNELGWLYGKVTLILFDHDNFQYECRMSKLKEYAEGVLKEKRFLLLDQPDAVGYLRKDDSARIVGFLDVKDVIEKVGYQIVI